MAKTQFKNIIAETELYPASDLYNKTEINNKIGGAIHYKGSVATYTDLLAITDQEFGDMYNVKATGKNYVWAENPEMSDPPVAGWDDISTTVDLSNYYTKTEADAEFASKDDLTNGLANKVDKDGNKVLSDNNYTTTEKNKLAGIDDGAEVNTIETVKVNNSALTPDANKAVNIPKANSSTLGVVKLTSIVPTDQASIDSDAALSQMAGWSIGQAMNNKAGKVSNATNGNLAGLNANGDLTDSGYAPTDFVAVTGDTMTGTLTISSNGSSAGLASTGLRIDNGTNVTIYSGGAIVDSTNGKTFVLPSDSGTLALKSDIPGVVNSYGTVKVGNTNLTAASAGDTIEIVAGSNITVTPDTTNGKKITISSSSAVTSVNSKTGAVVLTTSDLANDSGYITASDSSVTGKVAKASVTNALTSTVLTAFPTSGYTVAELVTHYNKLIAALSAMVTNINNQ